MFYVLSMSPLFQMPNSSTTKFDEQEVSDQYQSDVASSESEDGKYILNFSL